MASLSNLRDAIKSRYRLTNDEMDQFISDHINQAYKKYGRKYKWRGMLDEGNTLTLTAGTETYDLPDDFWRIVESSVRLFVTAEDTGEPVKVVNQDDLAVYKLIPTAYAPRACCVVAPATGNGPKRLEFQPPFSQTTLTVEYDYFKTPNPLVDDVDDPVVEEMEEVIIYDVLVHLATFDKRPDLAQTYKEERRDQLVVATQGFSST